MDTKQIKQVITMFEQSNIHSMELELNDMKILLVKSDKEVKTIEKDLQIENEIEIEQSSYDEIKAPLVGTYYSSASENSEPFIAEGSIVKQGDTICIIEAMKVMNEIKATRDGVIKEIKVESGQMVQFDETLFTIGDPYDS